MGLGDTITESENRQANFDFASGKFFVAGSSSLIAGCTICAHSDGYVGIQTDKTAFELALDSPGSRLEVKPPQSEPVTQFSTTRPGIRVGRDCGRIRLILRNQIIFPALPVWEHQPKLRYRTHVPAVEPATHHDPPNPRFFPGTLQSQNLNFKQGRVQQFNLNIEHQLPGNVVLTAGMPARAVHTFWSMVEP